MIIWLTVQPSALNAIAQTLAGQVEVAFAAATTGASNIVAFVVMHDLDELYNYLDLTPLGRGADMNWLRHHDGY